MPPHERRNTWPEYERLVLQEIEKAEKRIGELERQVVKLRIWIGGATGIILFVEFLLKFTH